MQMRYQALRQAPLLKEKYPQLEELTIHMSFENPDWGGDPSDQDLSFHKKSKAFFDVKCPRVECINGGFNLSDAVSELIENKNIEATGNLICQGWQDREHINKHRCLLKMSFALKAEYNAGG